MPRKHAVSFKHLIATSSRDQDLLFEQHRTYPTQAVPVQELLDRSRSARPVRPVLVDDVGGQGVTWIPRPAGRLDLELEEGPSELHLAEQLRRAQLAQRQARRSVAGPAPPPSWRSPRTADTASARSTGTEHGVPQISEHDFHEASRLFSSASGGRIPPPRLSGAGRLTEYCFTALIRYLDSDQVVWSALESQSGSGPRADGQGTASFVTLGRAMREGLLYLDTHLKIALLGFSSSRATGDGRLSDRSIRGLLLPPPTIDTILSAPSGEEEETWDDPSDMTVDRASLIHHLGPTAHPSPHIFLRNITTLPLAALTSLDLAYSVVPKEAERLVNALPVGLRELGLVGVRCEADEKGWTRFLVMLGRKLIVLKMLDVSSPPHPVDRGLLENLLHPPHRQLPSLRLLGLRGTITADPQSGSGGFAEKRDALTQSTPGAATHSTHEMLTRRRELARTVRKDRSYFIEVVWE